MVVGRIVRDDHQRSRLSRPQWAWLIITIPLENGLSDSMAVALEEVRARASDEWDYKPYGWPDARM